MVRFPRRRGADPVGAAGQESPTGRLHSAPAGGPDTVAMPSPGPATPTPDGEGLTPGRPVAATEVLGRSSAGVMADPTSQTQMIDVRPAGQVPGATAGSSEGLRPLVSRRVAAEIGVYVGAALVAVAISGVGARGWPDWGEGMRAGSLALAGLGLLSAGSFVRMPWSRSPGDGRRRAASTLLTAGVCLSLAAVGVVADASQTASIAIRVGFAVVAVLAMLLVCLAARTPLSELGLLGALVWGSWLLAPPGTITWSALLGLGVAWAALAVRGARGKRTAAVAGSVLALVSSVGLAQGSWAWPVRGALAAVAVAGLGMFLRGGANPWLALGAAAATALAASVAGGVLGPALALVVGGLATMGVSAVALHGTRRER